MAENLEMIARLRAEEFLAQLKLMQRAMGDFARGSGIGDTKRNFKEMNDVIGPLGREMKNVLEPSLRALGITSLSVTGILGGLIYTARNVAQTGVSMKILSDQSRISVENIAKFGIAAERVGVDVGTANAQLAHWGDLVTSMTSGPVINGMTTMTSQARELRNAMSTREGGVEIFDKMLLYVQSHPGDAWGAMRLAFAEIAKLPKNIRTDLLDLLGFSRQFGDMGTELAKVGPLITSNVRLANEFADAWSNVSRATKSYINAIGNEYMPVLGPWMEWFAKKLAEHAASWQKLAESADRFRNLSPIGQRNAVEDAARALSRKRGDIGIKPGTGIIAEGSGNDAATHPMLDWLKAGLPKSWFSKEEHVETVKEGTHKGMLEGLREWFQQNFGAGTANAALSPANAPFGSGGQPGPGGDGGPGPANVDITGGQQNASGNYNPISSTHIGGGVGGNSRSRGPGGHQGDDLMAPYGSPVFAAGNGTIERISTDNFGQPMVRIRHDDGSSSSYLHLDPSSVRGLRPGQRVTGGQQFARSGSAGGVPHLHFERRDARGNLISPRAEAQWKQQPGSVVSRTGGVRASVFNDPVTASGISPNMPGIALPTREGLGQLHEITTPDGRKFQFLQTDVGPHPRTRRGLDINYPAAQTMGYPTGNAFPTDQGLFKIERALSRDYTVNGNAKIRVDVNAPPGTQVDAEADGVFKRTEVNRSFQMGFSDYDGKSPFGYQPPSRLRY